MNLRVVSNTSPLIFLSKLAALDLLNCFTELSIPRAVQNECKELVLPKSIEVIDLSPKDKQIALLQLGKLHQGELEAIQLAILINANYVLMDDARARDFAATRGVNSLGTIGILLLANKRKRLTKELGLNYLDDLKNKHGIYISESLFIKVKNTFI